MEVTVSHNDLYQSLSEILSITSKQEIIDAFLYSLSTRNLEYRAYLACYVYALSIPKHDIYLEVYESGNMACSYCCHCHTCSNDTNQLDVELVKWGGVRFHDVFTIAYYLDKFSKMPKVKPTKNDFDTFNQLIETIRQCDENAKPRDLEKTFGKIIKSNKGEREMLINQLGIIGVLDTVTYNGFYQKYTAPRHRAIPPVNKIDWFFPVCWWRGRDNLNEINFSSIFNEYNDIKKII